jgi:transcriptional regulator with XRE-family HTH domain
MPDDEIDDTINELKALAKEKGLSQADLARLLGVTRQRVNDWFIGKVRPNLPAYLKVKAFLKTHRKRRPEK